MGVNIKIGDDEISLTDFTVLEFKKSVVQPEGDDIYLSKRLDGIKLKGQFKVFDNSKEKGEVYKLSDWAILCAHEEKVYKTFKLTCTDNNNNIYDAVVFDKSFVVEFCETYNQGAGVINFELFIKRFDDVTETAIKL